MNIVDVLRPVAKTRQLKINHFFFPACNMSITSVFPHFSNNLL